MSNLVGCDCLRKNEDTIENIQINNININQPKISLLSQQTTIDDTNFFNYKKTQTNLSLDYFDGKIDVKNYIQKADTDSLDNYEKINRVGKGSYSSVYKVKNKHTNLIRAMKVIPKNFQKDNKEIMREINILKNLDHPNVMKIFEFLEDDTNYYLIQEFCDEGDLETALDKKKVYCEFLVKFIMYQVFLAINYLHSNNIVHQDIKKKNISIIKLDEEKENDIQKLDYKNSFKKAIKRMKS